MKRILVAVDFSEVTSSLIEEAIQLAQCSTTRIYMIHVAGSDPDFVGYGVGPIQERQFRAKELHTQKARLERLATELREMGIDAVALAIQGDTAKLLLSQAKRLQASLIIMGTHGKGLARAVILGSVSQDVVRHTPCPVMLVPYEKQA